MTHAASDATPYSSFLFSIRTIPDPASKKTLKRYSWSRRILRHLHFERKKKKEATSLGNQALIFKRFLRFSRREREEGTER